MLRYFILILFAVMSIPNIRAIDFKHIGTYHNAMGDALCEISGEYKDGSLSVLQISLVADSTRAKATCIIEGGEIKWFCKSLQKFRESVSRMEERKTLILSHTQNALRPMDILTPRCSIAYTKECDGEFMATKGNCSMDYSSVVIDDKLYFMISCRKRGGKAGIYNKMNIKDESGKIFTINSNSSEQMGFILFRSMEEVDKFMDIVSWDRIKNERRLK